MTAKIQVSPELLTILGRKLYSGNPLFVLVRELIQNAMDSQADQIDLTIHSIALDDYKYKVSVTCDDNGIGMNDSEIQEFFLTLGASNKPNGSNVGGFGIAKAAILSHHEWSILTNGYSVTSDDILNGNEIRRINQTQRGTKVTVTLDDNFQYGFDSILERIKLMVRYTVSKSDLSVTVIQETARSSGETTVYTPEYQKLSRVSTFKEEEDLTVIAYKNLLSTKPYGMVRVNGLPQIVEYLYSSQTVDLILDITTTLIPTSNEYPLSISRESLEGEISDFWYTLKSEFKENPLSSSNMPNLDDNEEKIFTFEGESVNPRSYNPYNRTKGRPSKIQVTAFHYGSKSEAYRAKVKCGNMLRLWSELINLVLYANRADITPDVFTLGLMNSGKIDSINAARESSNLGIRYLISDKYADRRMTDEEYLLDLFFLACHEVTHSNHSSHNEEFSSGMHVYFTQALPYFLRDKTYLLRLAKSI